MRYPRAKEAAKVKRMWMDEHFHELLQEDLTYYGWNKVSSESKALVDG
jgi:hypothetical protein